MSTEHRGRRDPREVRLSRSRPVQVSDRFAAEVGIHSRLRGRQGRGAGGARKTRALVIMYLVLHKLVRNQTVEKMTEWALNCLIAHFDLRFISERSDAGAVCIDRLDPKFGYSYQG